MFQHIPDPEIVRGCMRKAACAAAPGGIFKLQAKTKPWAGHTGELDTRVGAALDPETVRGWLLGAGFEVLAGYPANECSHCVVAGRAGGQS